MASIQIYYEEFFATSVYPMSLDVRGLRSFVAVASAGSITRAAENKHIAQPALSLHIKQIEEQIGARLFDRTPKGVKLTAVGQRLLPHALDILKRLDIAFEDVRGAISEPSGRVAIGLPQSLAKFLTVPLVGAVVRRWPKIQFQMLEMSTGYIPEQLARGHIDIGLSFCVEPGLGITFTPLLDEELVFVTSQVQLKQVLRQWDDTNESISLKSISKFPMVLPSGTHSLRRLIDEYIKDKNVELDVIAEVNTIPQLIEVIAADIGSAILSYASIFDSLVAKKIKALKVSNLSITRPVYLCKSATAPVSIANSIVQELLYQIVDEMVGTDAWPGSFSRSKISSVPTFLTGE